MNWAGSLMTLNSSRGCHGGGSGNSDEDRTSDRESLVKRWSNRRQRNKTNSLQRGWLSEQVLSTDAVVCWGWVADEDEICHG